MIYHEEGHGVIQNPVVHLIYWGKNFVTTAEGGKVQEMLSNLFGGLTASSAYQGILTQYFDSTGRVAHEASVVPAYIDEGVSAPTGVNAAGVEQEISKAIAANNWPTGKNDLFLIFTAPHSEYESGFLSETCAYHGATQGGVIYGFVPYQGDPPLSTEGCISIGNPSGDPIRKTSKSASHEYAEAVTDPFLDSWFNRSGEEIADVCSQEEDIELGSGAWVQNQFDNYLGRCTHEDLNPAHVYVLTDPTAEVGRHEAALMGTVNTEGETEATYHFEYGNTTSYGHKAPETDALLAISRQNQSLRATISGLQLNTAYHYRIAVTFKSGNTHQTIYGRDQMVVPSEWSTDALGSSPAELSSVSCVAVESCVAVGEGTALAWKGGAWAPLGTLSAESLELEGVSCSTVSACSAVGSKSNGSSGRIPAAYAWNGSTWTSQAVSLPNGGKQGVLRGVSCFAAGECIAVGYSESTENVWVPYAARLRGGEWEIKMPAAPSATHTRLDSVSCTSANACMAVGQVWPEAKPGPETIISELWNGSSWSIVSPKEPTGTNSTELFGVSCSEANACTAVGDYLDGQWLTLAERWNGTEWSIQSTPEPSESHVEELDGVSCAGPDSCTAVGSWENRPAGLSPGLVETWNGSTWQISHESPSTVLDGVSCAGQASCAAVGRFRESAGHESLAITLLPTAKPAVVSVTPSLGPIAGGGAVKLKGHNFATLAAVTIGGAAATSVEVVSETEIRAKVPARAPGSYEVVVSDEGGTSSGGATYTYSTAGARYAATYGSAGAEGGQFSHPQGAAVDGKGNLWLVDTGNNRVEEFSATGEYLRQLGSAGTGNGQFNGPSGVAIAPGGDIWVTDSNNARVEEFTPEGKFITQFGKYGSGEGQFIEPTGIAIASNGSMWVADSRYYRVEEFSPAGVFIRQAGGFATSVGVAIDRIGNVWVTDSGKNRVEELSAEGEFRMTFGWGVKDGKAELETCTEGAEQCRAGVEGTGNGELYRPAGLAIGAEGDLWVVDSWNQRVQVFSATGQYITQFGSSGSGPSLFWYPDGISISGSSLYVVDSGNNRVENWTTWETPPPQVETKAASSIAQTTATLNATVNPNSAEVTECKLEYGTTTSYGSSAPCTPSPGSGSGPVEVHAAVGGLGGNTTYHFRIVATSAAGTSYGSDRSFKTLLGAPKVETGTASAITQTTATLNATVNPEGSAVTECKLEYGTNTSYGSSVACTPSPGSGINPVAVSGALSKLVTNTTYHFRVLAKSAGGTSTGSDQTVKTLPNVPTVVTGTASSITPASVTLNATVNPNGGEVSECRLEYGTGTSYGSSLPCTPSPGAGNSPAAVSASVAGLAANSTYHYRVSATNAGGTSKGSDSAFTTAKAPSYAGSFGSEGSGGGQFKAPLGVAIDSKGNVWVADSANNRIEEFSSSGTFTLALGWGVKDGKAQAETCSSSCKAGIAGSGAGQLKKPWGVAVAPKGEVWVVDSENNRVEEFGSNGNYMNRSVGSSGSGNGQLKGPSGIAVDSKGNLWVADSANNRVEEFSENGSYLSQIGSLLNPQGVVVDPAGNVWVADSANNRVEEFSSSGTLTLAFGWGVKDGKAQAETCTSSCKAGIAGSGAGQFHEPTGFTLDSKGYAWVVDRANSRVEEFSPTGEFLISFGSGGAGTGQFSAPWGIGVAGGSAYVADSANNRVQRWTAVE